MDHFNWKGLSVIKDVERYRQKGIMQAGEFLLDQSNKRVPKDEGTLQQSGSVYVTNGGADGAISYNTPYAVRQHESMHYNHPNGREAKFLENTMKNDGDKARDYVANEIKKAFKG